jgi:hypothetical protein
MKQLIAAAPGQHPAAAGRLVGQLVDRGVRDALSVDRQPQVRSRPRPVLVSENKPGWLHSPGRMSMFQGSTFSGHGEFVTAPVAGLLSPGRSSAPLAGASWQPTQVGVGGLGGLDADPAVDGPGAVGAGDHGAQLELGDLRQVLGHPGDPQ